MAIAKIIKYEGDNSTFIWKHPTVDFNSMMQLIVGDSQEAVFVMNGMIMDVFGPGKYNILDSRSLPILGKYADDMAYRNESVSANVYFINRDVPTVLEWAVSPDDGTPLKIGASGSLDYVVKDPRKFLEKLTGTSSGVSPDASVLSRLSDPSGLKKSLQDLLLPLVNEQLGARFVSIIKEDGINAAEICQFTDQLATPMREKINESFGEYGLSVSDLSIKDVIVPEEYRDLQKDMGPKQPGKKKKWPVIFLLTLAAVLGFMCVTVFMPKMKYHKAASLYKKKDYQAAYELYTELGDYKDSVELSKNVLYDEAAYLYGNRDYQGAYELYTELGDYKDSVELSKNVLYDRAVALYNEGDLESAQKIFDELNDFKEALSYALRIRLGSLGEATKDCSVGDRIKFGKYEQDNVIYNGKEDVEWKILAKNGNKILVISEYALDCQMFNSSLNDVTWESCSVRRWLNDTFYNAAFSEDEKQLISAVNVPADRNPDYVVDPGNATKDKVFLLSVREANRYFGTAEERQCKATTYTSGFDINENDSGYCWWWLRSPGHSASYTASIRIDGTVCSTGNYVINSGIAIRPALWIDLSLFNQ